MKFETTVNMMWERWEWLAALAQNSGMDYRELVRLSLLCWANAARKGKFRDRTLEYQGRALKWKKVHYNPSCHEYDVFLDLKKVLRFSFSYMVAMALDEYAEKIINGEITVSYQLEGYSKICLMENNYPIYIFCWKKNNIVDKYYHKRE
jgi:hypothetical protein